MEIAIIIIAVLLVAVITLLIVLKLRKNKYRNFIINNSVTIAKVLEINNKYDFENVYNKYMEHTYDNDTFYNNILCIDYLIYQLQFEKKDIELEKKKVLRNREKFNNYKKEIESIDTFGQFNSSTEKLNVSYLCSLEKEMFEESILLPKQNLYVLVRLYHSNINGRILERKEQEFELSEVESLIKRLNNKTGNFYNDRDIWDSICRVERGKVSNKMRFSIYDRDGYRCRYCGRSGKFWDLEIDHIKPISKGGKSTYDNLQTLCKRCNKEKGNKY
jgi:hypothetical protein